MTKNPFVNCKSRKRRKTTATSKAKKSKPKLFCPRTMVRYDNSPNEYGTVFVCKMCLTCVLSEVAARAHVLRCNDSNKRVVVVPVKKDDDSRYICETCNRVFSRKVALKKHQEQHEKTSDLESEEEFVPPPSRKVAKAATTNVERMDVDHNVEEVTINQFMEEVIADDVGDEHMSNSYEDVGATAADMATIEKDYVAAVEAEVKVAAETEAKATAEAKVAVEAKVTEAKAAEAKAAVEAEVFVPAEIADAAENEGVTLKELI